jgi:predicted O-linked N-acetylglucosamine transferase (SPINDLY family)
MSGHTGGNRLLTFARKPAPVQITWIGYAGSTGMEAMDYILADRRLIPEGAEVHYRERVLRMPDDYICYDPPAHAPPVGPLPARTNGYVTFASFNNPSKVTPPVVALWAAILRQTPGSRFMSQFRGLGDAATRQRFVDLFAANGVAAERLELKGPTPQAEFLEQYNRVDLALDPFPYSGCTTTCEALWMGVPVVTFVGETFAGRQSLTHLANVGLSDLAATDSGRFVEIASALAGDLERLAALRAGLRERVARSPLCDGPRFADNLLMLLRTVWQKRGWKSCQERMAPT